MPFLAEATGTAGALTIALTNPHGRTEEFRIRPLKMRTAGVLQDWLNRRPGPRAVEKVRPMVADLEPTSRKEIILGAVQEDARWPPSVTDSPGEALAVMNASPDGVQEFLLRVFQQARPDLAESEIRTFLDDIDLLTHRRIMAAALGVEQSDLSVRPEETTLLLLDPSGLERLVESVVHLHGGEPDDEKKRVIVDAVRSMMTMFGRTLSVAVTPERAVEVPKDEAPPAVGRNGSSHSTCAMPTP